MAGYALAYILYCGKAEAYAAVFHRKLSHAPVYIRRQHLYSPLAAVVNILGYLAHVLAYEAVHLGCHELHRVVFFEIRRSVCQHCVCGSVGLVKGIGRKVHHLVEYAVCGVTVNSVSHRARYDHLAVLDYAVYEVLPFLSHHLVLFLGHSSSHEIAPAPGIARKVAHYLHYLLLVYHTTVGLFQYGLKLFVGVLDIFSVVSGGDITGYLLHGAGAEKGNTRNYIFKAVGLKLHHELTHAVGLQLEHAVRIPLGYHLEYGRVIVFHALKVGYFLALLPYEVKRILYNRQVAQAQKVHLKKAQLLYRILGELGGYGVLVAL